MTDNVPIDIIRSNQDEHAIGSRQLDQPASDQLEALPAEIDPGEKYNRDVPPDGGYGWVCVACIFWMNVHTWGINSSYGVFLSYYLSHNVFPNTSALSYAFTGGLSISCALLVAPLATYLIRLLGTRFVLNLGVFFEVVSLIGSSFVTQKWQIFLSQGVCFGWGMGFLYVGSAGITPQWFHKHRGLAQGITASGSGMGGLIYSLAVGAIIPRLGLSNKAVGSRLNPFHLPLLRRPQFWMFLGWGFFSMLGYIALLFSVANFALSIGLTSHQGSIVSAMLNLGQGLGRPFVGVLSDRLGRINIAAFLTFLCGLFCLVIWIFADSMGVVCFFAVLTGTVSGTYWASASPVLAEIIGLRDLPSGLSLAWLWLVPPCTVSEAIALELRRPTANGGTSYLHVQLYVGFVYIGAAACLWVVRAWKVGEVEQAEQRQVSAVPDNPLVGNNATKEKREQPATSSSGPAPETTGAELWAPVGLIRRMGALRRV
ncbi:hypothetical protein N7470_000103 [Penicillium chermesinum]|nr:hypothetical protein N7470_000103 [Penicillium chermesinum]